MPNKPLMGLAPPRRAKPKSVAQKKASTSAAVREVKIKNLEKARRVRAKNLKEQKRSAKGG